MSFIQSTLKCKHCGYEMNVATGTFGYGVPKACPYCLSSIDQFEQIGARWMAKNGFRCRRGHFFNIPKRVTVDYADDRGSDYLVMCPIKGCEDEYFEPFKENEKAPE